MTKIAANFNRPVIVDITIPLVDKNNRFQDHDLEMTMTLVKGKDGDKYFTEQDKTTIADVLKKHIKTPPSIINESTNKAYTLTQLLDVTYVRDIMFKRLLEVSTNPMAAKGN